MSLSPCYSERSSTEMSQVVSNLDSRFQSVQESRLEELCRLGSMCVYARVRPLLNHEIGSGHMVCIAAVDGQTVRAVAPETSTRYKSSRQGHEVAEDFKFTRAFGPEEDQFKFFEETMMNTVKNFIEGQNSLVFSYGITGSGKTYTLQGDSTQPGIITIALKLYFASIERKIHEKIFIKPDKFADVITLSKSESEAERKFKESLLILGDQESSSLSSSSGYSTTKSYPMTLLEMFSDDFECEQRTTSLPLEDMLLAQSTYAMKLAAQSVASEQTGMYSVWVSFLEIYNEQLYDLLQPNVANRQSLKLAEDKNNDIYVKGLREICVQNCDEALKLLAVGRRNLKIASTKLNYQSSRSHCIFTIKVIRIPDIDNLPSVKVYRLSFCDLAGSERSSKAQTSGIRLKEAGNINTSLHVLGKCLNQLRLNTSLREKKLIPFRESKLTRLFSGFFMGRGKAVMITNASPSTVTFDETFGVLEFSAVAQDVMISDTYLTSAASTLQSITEWANTSWANDSQAYTPEDLQAQLQDREEQFEKLLKIAEDLKKRYGEVLKENYEMEQKTRQQVCQEYSEMTEGMQKRLEAIYQKEVTRNRECFNNQMKKVHSRYRERIRKLQEKLEASGSSSDENDSDSGDVDMQSEDATALKDENTELAVELTVLKLLDSVSKEIDKSLVTSSKDKEEMHSAVEELQTELRTSHGKTAALNVQVTNLQAEIQKFEAQKSELLGAVNSGKTVIENLQKDKKDLMDQKETLVKQLEGCRTELDSISASSKEMQAVIQDLENQQTSLRGELKAERVALEVKSVCFTQLQKEKEELKEMNRTLKSRLGKTQQEVVKLNIEISTIEADGKRMEKQKLSLEKLLEEEKTDHRNAVVSLSEQNKEIEKFNSRISEQEKTIRDLSSAVEENKTLQNRLSRGEEEIKEVQLKVQESEMQHQLQQDEIAKFSAKIEKLEKENEACALVITENESLKQQLKENEKEKDAAVSKLRQSESSSADLQADVEKYNAKITQLEGKLQASETTLGELESLKIKLFELEKEKDCATLKLQDYEKQDLAEQSDMAKYEDKINRMKQEFDSLTEQLKGKLTETEIERNRVKEKLQEYEEKCRAYQSELEKRTSEINALEKEIQNYADLVDQGKTLRDKLDQSEESENKILLKLQQAEVQCLLLQEENKSMQDEKNLLQEELRKCQAEIARLTEETNNMQANISRLERENLHFSEELKNQLSTHQAEAASILELQKVKSEAGDQSELDISMTNSEALNVSSEIIQDSDSSNVTHDLEESSSELHLPLVSEMIQGETAHELERLKSENLKHIATINQLNDDLEEKTAIENEKEEQIKKNESVIDGLTGRIANFKNEVLILTAENSEINGALNELKQQLQVKDKQLLITEEEKSKAIKVQIDKQSEVDCLSSEISSLKANVADLQTRIEEILSDRILSEKTVNELQSQLQVKGEKLRTAEKENNTLYTSVNLKQDEIKKLLGEITSLKCEMGQLQNELEQKMSKDRETGDVLDKLKSEHKAKNEELLVAQKAIKEATREINDKHTEVNKLLGEISSLRNDIDHMQGEVKTKQLECDQIRDSLSKKEEELNIKSVELAKGEDEICDLNEQLGELNREKSKLASKNEKLEKSVKEMVTVTAQLKESQSTISTLKSELSNLKRKHELESQESSETIKRFREEIDSVKLQNASLHELVGILESCELKAYQARKEVAREPAKRVTSNASSSKQSGIPKQVVPVCDLSNTTKEPRIVLDRNECASYKGKKDVKEVKQDIEEEKQDNSNVLNQKPTRRLKSKMLPLPDITEDEDDDDFEEVKKPKKKQGSDNDENDSDYVPQVTVPAKRASRRKATSDENISPLKKIARNVGKGVTAMAHTVKNYLSSPSTSQPSPVMTRNRRKLYNADAQPQYLRASQSDSCLPKSTASKRRRL